MLCLLGEFRAESNRLWAHPQRQLPSVFMQAEKSEPPSISQADSLARDSLSQACPHRASDAM
jgi:hypothetical protein